MFGPRTRKPSPDIAAPSRFTCRKPLASYGPRAMEKTGRNRCRAMSSNLRAISSPKSCVRLCAGPQVSRRCYRCQVRASTHLERNHRHRAETRKLLSPVSPIGMLTDEDGEDRPACSRGTS